MPAPSSLFRVGKILIYIMSIPIITNYIIWEQRVHLQIGIRNNTVLIYQFENNMFHLQLGTRNDDFSVLHYSELFPPAL